MFRLSVALGNHIIKAVFHQSSVSHGMYEVINSLLFATTDTCTVWDILCIHNVMRPRTACLRYECEAFMRSRQPATSVDTAYSSASLPNLWQDAKSVLASSTTT